MISTRREADSNDSGVLDAIARHGSKTWSVTRIAIAAFLAFSIAIASHIPSAVSSPSAVAQETPPMLEAPGAVAPVPLEWMKSEIKKAKAPVILDGRPLFLVSRVREYRADFRANLINDQLQKIADSGAPIDVQVVESNQLPTIVVNNRQLLTVTEADAPDGLTLEQQADLWAQQLEKALQEARKERSSRFIWRSLIVSIAIFALSLVLHSGLGKLWNRYRQPLTQLLSSESTEDGEESSQGVQFFLSFSLAIARAFVWLGAAFYITNSFPLTRQWSYRILEALRTAFASPILTLGSRPYSLIDILILTGMLLGLVAVASKTTQLLKSRILKIAGMNRGAQEAVAIVTKYGLIFIGTLVLLQVWGLDISSLTIVVSALSVAIGFGLQDIAKNFGSGLVLLFERPIQVGDFVEVGEYSGTVERIGSRSTVIRTLDRVSIIVPNSRFLENEVINWSHDNPVSRLHLPVGVAYGSDIQGVEAALLDAAKGHPDVLLVPPPNVLFLGFGDSSLDFELLVWSAEPSKQYYLKSELYFRIYALLEQREIEIPFPQRDLHVRSGSLPLDVPPGVREALVQWLDRLDTNGKH
ncbi:mechanosensitive ion channel family protein [Oxynema aestuarii]|jgi:potassium efflux system protein|uniref:Mechanosensitive ion channel n=1 Tax=Oxynema aestuarii AP17 TaxID=2064643 RepID=A0A6H1U1V2_9CYAN|nr:mechanosensitive ion channel domain-containing protein [Oxynema aestuarii]QIZ72150.1 mechanosensitive ion channel [Oxynema aestuarii AP17]